MNRILAIPTGIANLASVRAAFARLHVELALARDGDDVAAAAAVLLPGVGDFGAGMRALARDGLGRAFAERVRSGRPVLAICLGMQLCLHGSDESPATPGLGALPGHARRFGPTVRCPQMGWNLVRPAADAGLLRAGHAWFANSYRLTEPPAGWQAAVAEHDGPFVAALARPGQLLCQFHPELSGRFGHDLLSGWLATVRPRSAAC